MNFQKNEYKGYKNKEKYKRKLTFLKQYGNSKERTVQFRDENGTILTWNTSDNSKTFKNLKYKGYYSFKVSAILNNIDESKIKIVINYVKESLNKEVF